jgi:hypothetical protein
MITILLSSEKKENPGFSYEQIKRQLFWGERDIDVGNPIAKRTTVA